MGLFRRKKKEQPILHTDKELDKIASRITEDLCGVRAYGERLGISEVQKVARVYLLRGQRISELESQVSDLTEAQQILGMENYKLRRALEKIMNPEPWQNKLDLQHTAEQALDAEIPGL